MFYVSFHQRLTTWHKNDWLPQLLLLNSQTLFKSFSCHHQVTKHIHFQIYLYIIMNIGRELSSRLKIMLRNIFWVIDYVLSYKSSFPWICLFSIRIVFLWFTGWFISSRYQQVLCINRCYVICYPTEICKHACKLKRWKKESGQENNQPINQIHKILIIDMTILHLGDYWYGYNCS